MAQINAQLGPTGAVPDFSLQASNLGQEQIGRAVQNFGNVVQDTSALILNHSRQIKIQNAKTQVAAGLMDAQQAAIEQNDPVTMKDVYLAKAGVVRQQVGDSLGDDAVLQREFNNHFTNESLVYQHLVNRHAFGVLKQNGVDSVRAALDTYSDSYVNAGNDAQRQAAITGWNTALKTGTSFMSPGQLALFNADFQKTVRAGVAKQTLESVAATTNQTVDDAVAQNFILSAPMDTAAAAKKLDALRDNPALAHVNPQLVDKAIVDNVAHSAVRNRNYDALKILDNIKTRDGQPLSAAFETEVGQAEQRITDRLQTADTRSLREDERAKKQATSDLYAQMVPEFSKGNTDPIPWVNKANAIDPEQAGKIVALSKTFDEHFDMAKTNPKVYADLKARIMARDPTVGEKDLVDAYGNDDPRKRTLGKADFNELMNRLQYNRDNENPLERSPAIRSIQEGLYHSIAIKNKWLNDPKTEIDASNASSEFSQFVRDKIEDPKHAKISESELLELARKKRDELYEHYVNPGDKVKHEDMTQAPPKAVDTLTAPAYENVDKIHMLHFNSWDEAKKDIADYMKVDAQGHRTPTGHLRDLQIAFGWNDQQVMDAVRYQQQQLAKKKAP